MASSSGATAVAIARLVAAGDGTVWPDRNCRSSAGPSSWTAHARWCQCALMRLRDDVELGRSIDEVLHAFNQNGLDQPILDPGGPGAAGSAHPSWSTRGCPAAGRSGVPRP